MNVEELQARKKEAETELLAINQSMFMLKVRKAKAEKIIDQTDFELYKAQGSFGKDLVGVLVTDKDVTGHSDIPEGM